MIVTTLLTQFIGTLTFSISMCAIGNGYTAWWGCFGWINPYVILHICDTTKALKHIMVLFKQGYMIVANSVYALYKIHYCSFATSV